MSPTSTLYDEFPYKSQPIEWTAPERMALASLLHGGPRAPLSTYRVLELGCGNGTNVLPLAYYRRHAEFVGVDSAASQITEAESRKSALKLSNIEFAHADFRAAAEQLRGQFDYIVAHGIFSWVSEDVRVALLELCAQHLRQGGLLYLNYNTRPGWNVRGLVREFLLAQTADEPRLRERSELAKEVAATMCAALTDVDEHPYSQLLANEFRFVLEGDVTWVGHDILGAENRPYWRSEFLAIAGKYDLHYVADADFNYSSARIPEDLAPRLEKGRITGRSLEDTVDLLCYRQLHSPILANGPYQPTPPSVAELGGLRVASCLEPCDSSSGTVDDLFRHPSGYEVEAREECMREALIKLKAIWPRSLPIATVFGDVSRVADDLMLLQRNGLIELRCVEPADFGIPGGPLNNLERKRGGQCTTPYHTVATRAQS